MKIIRYIFTGGRKSTFKKSGAKHSTFSTFKKSGAKHSTL